VVPSTFVFLGGEPTLEKAVQFSGGFSQVDLAPRPEAYVQFMDDANSMGFFQSAKALTHRRLALQPGHAVLDIGCGSGGDVRAMAEVVGPKGRVVGLDGSATMIAAARQRSVDTGLPVEFVVGDAHRLDFDDKSFDACRTDRVLLHLADPGQALREIARVLRPGGRVVALEPDNGGLLVDHPDRDTTTRIMEVRSRATRSGWIGRSLRRLFLGADLTAIELEVLPSPRTNFAETDASLRLLDHADQAAAAGVVTLDAAERWKTTLIEAGERGEFFCLVTLFLVVGRKA
jgi:ubiquinone/menaquinone biosynthesis C-methylase UbiE